jgi:hypothetical protein
MTDENVPRWKRCLKRVHHHTIHITHLSLLVLVAHYLSHAAWTSFEALIKVAHIPSPKAIATVAVSSPAAIPVLAAVTIGCILLAKKMGGGE